TAGAAYRYQARAHDPDGAVVSFVLAAGPAGMSVDRDTGVLTWLPSADSPALAGVLLYVYDTRGGRGEQAFQVAVAGGNHAPVLDPVPAIVARAEGQPLVLAVHATDADGDTLVYWADNLPPAARFDPQTHALYWTPGFEAAGTYENVTLHVSDGL